MSELKPKASPTFNLTAEQEAIREAVRTQHDSLMVTAYAGCAKSTTLELIANEVPKTVPGLALAFNVKIKKELEARFPSTIAVKTLNGLGHAVWCKTINKRCEVDEKKQGKLLTAYCKDQEIHLTRDDWETARGMISMAMSIGLVPRPFDQSFPGLVEDSTEAWKDIAFEKMGTWSPRLEEIAREVLCLSIKQSYQGLISFDDQIFMSSLFKGNFPRYPLVMVDEAQDLSALNHIQLAKSAADRLIVVGDPKQAIYSFRGAHTESMGQIKALRKHWIELPLSMTFRVPRVMVQRQLDHAPGFRAAPTNKEGAFSHWTCAKPEANGQDRDEASGTSSSTAPRAHWSWSEWDALRPHPAASMAILCRNNAPLLAMAFKLIRQGIAATMLGRDIGKGLVALSRKLLPEDDTHAEQCSRIIEEWRSHQTAIARANDHEEKVAAINDRAECLKAVLEFAQAKTAGALRAALTDLFGQDVGKIILASIHRAKGLEYDMVLHLDPWRIPSKFARQMAAQGSSKQLKQELNLRYVCETRTRDVFVQANLEDFQ